MGFGGGLPTFPSSLSSVSSSGVAGGGAGGTSSPATPSGSGIHSAGGSNPGTAPRSVPTLRILQCFATRAKMQDRGAWSAVRQSHNRDVMCQICSRWMNSGDSSGIRKQRTCLIPHVVDRPKEKRKKTCSRVHSGPRVAVLSKGAPPLVHVGTWISPLGLLCLVLI